MKQDPKNVQAEIFISSYGTRIRCDVKTAAQLFELLARCQFVTNEWSGNGTCPVLEETLPRMQLSCEVPLTRDEFNSIREAERLEKEAAKEAAEQAAEE